jgi:hypothetical protein
VVWAKPVSRLVRKNKENKSGFIRIGLWRRKCKKLNASHPLFCLNGKNKSLNGSGIFWWAKQGWQKIL